MPLLARQIEGPFLTVRENSQWYAAHERVLKELAISTVTLADPLHFDECRRAARSVAEREVDSSTLNAYSGATILVSNTGHPSS